MNLHSVLPALFQLISVLWYQIQIPIIVHFCIYSVSLMITYHLNQNQSAWQGSRKRVDNLVLPRMQTRAQPKHLVSASFLTTLPG